MGDKRIAKKLKWFSKVKRVLKHGSRAQGSRAKECFVPATEQASTSTITENLSRQSPPIEEQEPPAELVASNSLKGKSREELAAIKIQRAFWAHQSAKSMRALRGLVRLKLLMGGHNVQRQSAHSLRSMQTLLRAQSQVTTRRIKFFQEKLALQNDFLLKHAIDDETLRLDEKWDHRVHSKEKIEANMAGKYEAAMRRERARAYSAAQQQAWKNSHKRVNPTRGNQSDPIWGWSWMDTWVTNHPSDDQSSSSKFSLSLKKSTPSTNTTSTGSVQSAARKRGSSSLQSLQIPT